jgi:DNA-directed RNA polymerase omega subunit
MMDPHTDIPQSEGQSNEPREPAAPIESRFMFVDVAALRAKQLRRGALARLETGRDAHHKLERVAMEEVRRGLIDYLVPERRAPEAPPA